MPNTSPTLVAKERKSNEGLQRVDLNGQSETTGEENPEMTADRRKQAYEMTPLLYTRHTWIFGDEADRNQER